MEMLSVNCNSCDAPLRVGTQVRFVSCQFCNTQLEIKRNESSIFTEQINRIADNTAHIAQDLEAIKLQSEIEMLDRKAATASVSQRADGSRSLGSGFFGLAFAIFFAVVCFTIAGTAGRFGAPGLFKLVPIGMGIFAVVAAFMALMKSPNQSERQDDLRRRRDALNRKLAEVNNQPKAGSVKE